MYTLKLALGRIVRDTAILPSPSLITSAVLVAGAWEERDVSSHWPETALQALSENEVSHTASSYDLNHQIPSHHNQIPIKDVNEQPSIRTETDIHSRDPQDVRG